MPQRLKDLNVAIIVAHGFEEVEMIHPRQALDEQGAITYLISVKDTVRAWHHGNWSDTYTADVLLDVAQASDYDALLLPGGVMSPDALRLQPKAITFIKEMGTLNKPIAAICHGAWTLINAQLVEGKTMTSWPSIRVDLENAGALWVDKETVLDGKLLTSRMPADIPAFNKAMIELFSR